MVEGYQTYWFVDTFLIYGGRLSDLLFCGKIPINCTFMKPKELWL